MWHWDLSSLKIPSCDPRPSWKATRGLVNLLVADDHLKIIAEHMGDKQIELDGFLVLPLHFGPNEDKAETLVPFLGLPAGLEVGHLRVEASPPSPPFDPPLEFGKAFKRHADGELDAALVQGGDDLVAEEGAVHPHLDLDLRQDLADGLDAGQNELPSPAGIVHVPGPVQE